MARQAAVIVDEPQPGFWKMRMAPGGWHEVPCRIMFNDESGLWSAEIDGGLAGAPDPDPIKASGVLDIWHARKTPITEVEYRFLCGPLKEWARAHYPDHPLLHPAEPVIAARLRPIPEFAAPAAPAPLAPEPLAENRPAAPKPLSPAEIADWLAYEHEPLANALAHDTATLALDRDRAVDDDATLARVSANVDIARAHLRQAEDARTRAKAPFRAGGTAVDDWFKRWTVALSNAIEPIQAAMNAYGARIEAARRAEAARAAAEAQAQAERAAAAAAAALQREARPGANTTADVLLDAAQRSAAEAQRANAQATGRAADLARSYSAYGKPVSAKEKWTPVISDIRLIPREHMTPNLVSINTEVQRFCREHPERARKGESPIPGVSIERSIDMRAR